MSFFFVKNESEKKLMSLNSARFGNNLHAFLLLMILFIHISARLFFFGVFILFKLYTTSNEFSFQFQLFNG